jgi:hypothetical protein
MEFANLPAEIYIFLLAVVLGVVIGYIHACQGTSTNPIWPIKVYLGFFKLHVHTLRKYASTRTTFTFREQFMAAAFIWFFVLFLSMIFVYYVLWS